jgi:hypothetical protein
MEDPLDLLKEVGLDEVVEGLSHFFEEDEQCSSYRWKGHSLMKGCVYRVALHDGKLESIQQALGVPPTFLHLSPDINFGQEQYFVSSIDVVKKFISAQEEGIFVLSPAEQARDERGSLLFDVLLDLKRHIYSMRSKDVILILVDMEESERTHYPSRKAIVQNSHQTLY